MFDIIDRKQLDSTESVLKFMQHSERACERRKIREIKMLQDQILTDAWQNRVNLLGFHPLRNRGFAAIINLNTPAMVWDGAKTVPVGEPFLMAISIPDHYPVAMPSVKFVSSNVPWCPQVVHTDRRFAPSMQNLLPEFQQMLGEGVNHLYYTRDSEWTPDPTENVRAGLCLYARDVDWTGQPHNSVDLNVLISHIARILSFRLPVRDGRSLNPAASDFALRHGPLNGPSLPYPGASDRSGPEDDDEIQWLEEGK